MEHRVLAIIRLIAGWRIHPKASPPAHTINVERWLDRRVPHFEASKMAAHDTAICMISMAYLILTYSVKKCIHLRPARMDLRVRGGPMRSMFGVGGGKCSSAVPYVAT